MQVQSGKTPFRMQFVMLLSAIVLILTTTSACNRQEIALNDPATTKIDPGPTHQSWTNDIGMEFVRIPAGTFVMGSDSDGAGSHEQPIHTVTISRPFYMATTEVTQAQWRAVVDSNPSRFQGDDRPVENVSWFDTTTFLKTLNSLDEKARYRLPTEAEWEYACRAGDTEDPEGDPESAAWFTPNSGGTTHPVGRKASNGWGLYDMLGNVYEWCEDWKGPYPSEETTDPRGPLEGSFRVMRGGSWLTHSNRALPYFRDFFPPDHRQSDVGFRVVAVARTP